MPRWQMAKSLGSNPRVWRFNSSSGQYYFWEIQMPYRDKDKQRAWQNAWMKKRRQVWIEENGPCACGSEVDLEIHHKDPTKKVTHRVWSWRQDRRLKELAKCIVECKQCHRGKHNEEMRKPISHGTFTGYVNHKCRCSECTLANTEHARAWRSKQKTQSLSSVW